MAHRRGIDGAEYAQDRRDSAQVAAPDNTRKQILTHLQRIAPRFAFSASDTTRQLAEMLWRAMGRSTELRCGGYRADGTQAMFHELSDDYVLTRAICAAEAFAAPAPVARRDNDPTVPADGMSPATAAAISSKDQRTRQATYLNTARTQLMAESGHRGIPNSCDVEDRAAQLAKIDEKGLFSK